MPPTIQTVCIVIDNTNRLYCSWLAIQTVCIVVGLQYKRFVLSAQQYKPFVLSSMQYKLFVLQLRATIQTVCIAGGSSYHTCNYRSQVYKYTNQLSNRALRECIVFLCIFSNCYLPLFYLTVPYNASWSTYFNILMPLDLGP